MIECVKQWYLDRLFRQLHKVNCDLNNERQLLVGSANNEYTEGWLAHVDRRVDDLLAKKARINRRIGNID